MTDLQEIRHVERSLPGGGNVLILNTKAEIPAESVAMLQALHSRSVGGIKDHLRVLAEKGSAGFMKTFYVGYNHKSIGDCGTGTIFIEGVSMLVAKAIQDWALYSGQEASTRYIDFASQPFVDPIQSELSNEILGAWRNFYVDSMPSLILHLEEKFPRPENEKEVPYKKAVAARAFDIMRGFLPAGATTNLAWHSNLRQMADHIALLRHHPLQDVKDVAHAMESALLEFFPNSFSEKRYPATEDYNAWWVSKLCYHDTDECSQFQMAYNGINIHALEDYHDIMAARPPKTELPKIINECGVVQFRFLLDFGSFRDIQRHRAVTQRMPLVTTKHGFADWYLNELPPELRSQAELLLESQEHSLTLLDTSPEILQHYTAMGYNLPNLLTGSIPALVYLVELRATTFVHPTLRVRAIQMAKTLSSQFRKQGLRIHLDPEPDRFDVKRGEHDIVRVD